MKIQHFVFIYSISCDPVTDSTSKYVSRKKYIFIHCPLVVTARNNSYLFLF